MSRPLVLGIATLLLAACADARTGPVTVFTPPGSTVLFLGAGGAVLSRVDDTFLIAEGEIQAGGSVIVVSRFFYGPRWFLDVEPGDVLSAMPPDVLARGDAQVKLDAVPVGTQTLRFSVTCHDGPFGTASHELRDPPVYSIPGCDGPMDLLVSAEPADGGPPHVLLVRDLVFDAFHDATVGEAFRPTIETELPTTLGPGELIPVVGERYGHALGLFARWGRSEAGRAWATWAPDGPSCPVVWRRVTDGAALADHEVLIPDRAALDIAGGAGAWVPVAENLRATGRELRWDLGPGGPPGAPQAEVDGQRIGFGYWDITASPARRSVRLPQLPDDLPDPGTSSRGSVTTYAEDGIRGWADFRAIGDEGLVRDGWLGRSTWRSVATTALW